LLVGELTKPNLFPDFKLIGGKGGLNNEVNIVAIIDAPDMDYWVSGGELLIGNGFVFKEDPSFFLRFVQQMAEKNVAAIGVKFDRFMASLNLKKVTEEADRLSLPIFQIPFNYRWSEILEKVALEINESEKDKSTMSTNISFLDDIQDPFILLSLLSKKTGRHLFFKIKKESWSCFFEPQDGELTDFNQKDGSEYDKASIISASPFPSTNSISSWREIRAFQNNQQAIVFSSKSPPFFSIHAFLKIGEKRLSQKEEKLFLRGFLALETLMKERFLSHTEHQDEISRIIELLVLGSHFDKEQVFSFFKKWRIPFPTPCRVALYRSSDGKKISTNQRGYLFCSSIIAGFITTLIPWKESDSIWKPENTIKILQTLHRPVSLGSTAANLEEIKNSFDQAKKLLLHVEKKKQSIENSQGVFLYDDMAFELAISLFAEIPEAKSLWEKYWKPLKAEGKSKCVPLQEFASELIDSNLNLSLCAKQLNIHYNTARNYLEEVNKTLGFSFSDSKHFLSFCLARQIDSSIDPKKDSH